MSAPTLSDLDESTWNQILNATGTSDILIRLFEARPDLVEAAKSAWKELHDALSKKKLLDDYTYPVLVAKLQSQGVI